MDFKMTNLTAASERMQPIETVLDRLPNHARSGNGYKASCPAHDDKKPSLSITEGEDGRVLLNCHAGSTIEAVVEAMGLGLPDLHPNVGSCHKPVTRPKQNVFSTAEQATEAYRLGPPSKEWLYADASGNEVGRILRWDTAAGKEIRPLARTPTGWTLAGMAGPRPLLNLPALLARAEDPVYVVEGEKCFDALEALGLLATTSAGGANAAKQTDWSPLTNRRVIVLPDNDDSGRKFAEDVVEQVFLVNDKADIQILELPSREAGDDIADIVARCKTSAEGESLREQLVVLAEVTAPEEYWPTTIADAAMLSQPETWTDLGLSRRFIVESAGQLRFSTEENCWLAWRGDRWERDPSGAAAQEVAKQVADRLQDEARTQPATAVAGCMQFALRAGSQAKIKAMVGLACSDKRIAIRSADMDAESHLLNCLNGVLDLEKGVLLPHSPRHLLSKIARVKYDPSATCPRWERFIREVTCDDQELAGFLQRTFGLALSGDVSEQFLWIHYGDGANGKTTGLEVLSVILGDYSGPIGADVLAVNPRSFERERGRAVHSLVGKRLAVAGESGPDAQLSEGLVKMLTGGDTVEAREIYGKAFSVKPSWHIHLCTNHRPNVQGLDHGVWRRLLVVPWAAVFGGQRADPKLRDHLVSEASGILNWLVAGFLEWKSSGLQIPQTVKATHEDYRRDCDPVRPWLQECCEMAPDAVTKSKPLYDHYRRWATDTGENPVSKQAFGRHLTQNGLQGDKKSGDRVWVGVRLQ